MRHSSHFFNIPIPRLVSPFEVEQYRVWSRFLKLNDTDTESGLVFLSERYRYRVRSYFLTIPKPRPGNEPLKVRDFNETRPRPKMNPGSVLAPYIL